MGARTPEVPVPRTGNVSHIRNKQKRQDEYQKYRKEKVRQKLQRRLQVAKEERTSKDGKARKKVGIRRRALTAGAPREAKAAHD